MLLVGCNDNLPSDNKSITSTPDKVQNTAEVSKSEEEVLLENFMEDASVPQDVRNDLIEAMHGNTTKQDSISYEDFNFKYEVFSSIDGDKEISKAECYFNVAFLYFNGDENSKFTVDKEKALKWWKLSSDNGFYLGAVYAGDILIEGDGMPRDYSKAFDFYQKAHELSENGIVYERLGDCYYFGYGTQEDKNKAYECYLNSAFGGDSQGLYKLLKMTDEGYGNVDKLLLSKAASSIDYDSGYFEVAYGDIDSYKMRDDKKAVVERLTEYWDKETDPAVKGMKASNPSNKWFSSDFLNEIKKTVYSYSYYGFVEEKGVIPNLTLEEVNSKIKDVESEENPLYYTLKASWGHRGFYEYDFTGDGKTELFFNVNSGAGGAFMADGIVILNLNEDGKYEYLTDNYGYALRDGVRLVQYGDKYYFLANPFSDFGDAPYDMDAFIFDEKGDWHSASLICKDYKAKKVVSSKDDDYISKHKLEGFLETAEKEAESAIMDTREHRVYKQERLKEINFSKEKEQLENNYLSGESGVDGYFEADINNDGKLEFIKIGHLISDVGKYYYDINCFDVFSDKEDMENNAVAINKTDISNFDYFGLLSFGNLYADYLPISSKLVQFWTQIYGDKTYCMAVTKQEELYTLQVYIIENGVSKCIYKSLYFDEFQGMDVKFDLKSYLDGRV